MREIILLKFKYFFKKAGDRVLIFLLALSLISRPIFFDHKALAATLNAGSNFTVCTSLSYQQAYTTEAAPIVTVYWTFSSSVNTQAAYQVQIDDDAAFGSVNVDSGVVSSAPARSYTTSSLSFGTRYYWRVQITDNLSSVTDWIVGDSFITLKQSLMLKGNIKLWGNIKLR